MKLLQYARDQRQHRMIKRLIPNTRFAVLPLTENIGHRALVHVEEYGLA